MFSFDKIPNELVLEILSYVMIRDTPFDMIDCIRTAKAINRSDESHRVASSLSVENDRFFEMSVEAFRSKELSTSYFEERNERRAKQTIREKSTSKWLLYDSSIMIQQPHLLDWRVASSVCNRFRRPGKQAFFSSKDIIMDLKLAKSLQEQSLTCLSFEDQQIASQHINAIILIQNNLQSPSPFILLPDRLAGFPHLRSLRFFFGGREGDPLAWILEATQHKMETPDHFINVLTTIGVPAEKLDLGILISPDTKWDSHEHQLKKYVYPMLRIWTTMKAEKK